MNTHAQNAIYIGAVGVLTTTGHIIPAGGSIEVRTVAAIRMIGTVGSVVTYLEEYD